MTGKVSDALLPHPPERIGVAVSGGGDSMALLQLLHRFCATQVCTLFAVTVDHGLRAGAVEEAALVARHCADLGIEHDILKWHGWDGSGNLQNAARTARYGLMVDWARTRGLDHVALGHTADDQAETLLMRLARRAGVDGLSGMAPRRLHDGITWLRPLLGVSRAELREYLRSEGVVWVEDPSNEDERFERIRARQTLAALAPLGIDAEGLSAVAANLSQARRALDWQTFLAARDMAEIHAGAVVFDRRRLLILPDEIQRRLLIGALNWISGAPYPPRRGAVSGMIKALQKGQAGTVDGCHARPNQGRIWVFREYDKVRDSRAALDTPWDGRWKLRPPADVPQNETLHVGPLGGAGLTQCPDWRATGRPHAVLLSTPAIWQGDALIAAPLAGMGGNWQAELLDGAEGFFTALLSH
ncbi:tRNA lysidine(34) synthetase TilS [Sulfitobacter aestuarii]|uniref:tRNA(Ile)-lysidine synthase n=1 Tax=Sulfitobacter aestuarii TaxID=2161676 RepID=A0ABW5TWE6_9RHOB